MPPRRTARLALRGPQPGTLAARIAGPAALAGMVATGLALALIAAGGRSPHLVNASRAGYPGWMAGVFGHLLGRPSPARFYVVFLAMCACYLLALACGRGLPARALAASIGALHLIFLLAPPLLSRDIFNYVIYARAGVVHHLNPYLHGTGALPFDPVAPYVCCHHSANPYGPLFTLGSYAVAPIGAHPMLWVLKAAVALAGLGCVALIWAAARRQGRDPLLPAALVGLNPVWLVLAIGGGHNDLLMELFVVGGISLWLRGAQAGGMATAVGALGVKASGAVVLPFMLVGSDRRLRALVAAVLTGVAIVAVWVGVFGVDAIDGWARAIGQQQEGFFQRSVPQQLALALDLGFRPAGLRFVLNGLLAVVVLWLLWRTWRGASWIVSAGWATFALLIATTWLLPWYVVWLLPLAALGDDRRLRIAALVATGYVIWARTPLILG